MSYYFDNNNRYQIIYPYTSNKIHVAKDINHGVHKCYQELKKHDVKTYIFMVHDIDSGMVYYFDIPKYKDLQDIDSGMTNNVDVTNNMSGINSVKNSQNQNNDNMILNDNVILNTNDPVTSLQSIQSIQALQSVPLQTSPTLTQHTTQHTEQNRNIQATQNEIITRLNHVEYQLDVLKKMMIHKPKKEDESSCVIM